MKKQGQRGHIPQVVVAGMCLWIVTGCGPSARPVVVSPGWSDEEQGTPQHAVARQGPASTPETNDGGGSTTGAIAQADPGGVWKPCRVPGQVREISRCVLVDEAKLRALPAAQQREVEVAQFLDARLMECLARAEQGVQAKFQWGAAVHERIPAEVMEQDLGGRRVEADTRRRFPSLSEADRQRVQRVAGRCGQWAMALRADTMEEILQAMPTPLPSLSDAPDQDKIDDRCLIALSTLPAREDRVRRRFIAMSTAYGRAGGSGWLLLPKGESGDRLSVGRARSLLMGCEQFEGVWDPHLYDVAYLRRQMLTLIPQSVEDRALSEERGELAGPPLDPRRRAPRRP